MSQLATVGVEDGELDEWSDEIVQGSRCACGAGPLRRYETMNGQCEACAEITRTKKTAVVVVPDDDGVPEEYRGFSIDNWQGALKESVRAYMLNPTGFLMVYGAPGRGKTHLATAILIEWKREGRWVLWRNVQTLARKILDDRASVGREVLLLTGCFLLMVDDFGAESEKTWASDVIREVIATRHMHGMATIITTNLSPSEIARDEPRMASRIASGARVLLDGPDWRMKK